MELIKRDELFTNLLYNLLLEVYTLIIQNKALTADILRFN